jgi:hypothetical protein
MRKAQRLCGVLVLILAGCGINRAALDRDIRTLLNKCNVQPKTVVVTISERSRTGLVECSVTADAVTAIVSGLGLKEVTGNTDDRELRFWLEDGRPQFGDRLLAPRQGVRVFRSTRRPQTLRLPSGSSFEYMLLFWDKEKGKALIQLSYAYG